LIQPRVSFSDSPRFLEAFTPSCLRLPPLFRQNVAHALLRRPVRPLSQPLGQVSATALLLGSFLYGPGSLLTSESSFVFGRPPLFFRLHPFVPHPASLSSLLTRFWWHWTVTLPSSLRSFLCFSSLLGELFSRLVPPSLIVALFSVSSWLTSPARCRSFPPPPRPATGTVPHPSPPPPKQRAPSSVPPQELDFEFPFRTIPYPRRLVSEPPTKRSTPKAVLLRRPLFFGSPLLPPTCHPLEMTPIRPCRMQNSLLPLHIFLALAFFSLCIKASPPFLPTLLLSYNRPRPGGPQGIPYSHTVCSFPPSASGT